MSISQAATARVAQAVRVVAVANLAYFFVEFTVAKRIGSVSLFADSIDFLEDAAVNGLILFGLAWPATARARLGVALAGILLVPGVATLWAAWGAWGAWGAWNTAGVPEPMALSLTGLGALAVNLAGA